MLIITHESIRRMEHDQSRIHHLIHRLYTVDTGERERERERETGQFENPDVNESQISTY